MPTPVGIFFFIQGSTGLKCGAMSLIPLSLWLPLSVAACVLLVLAAMGWLWRSALRVPAGSRDGRNMRNMATIASAGLLLWLAYGLFKGYGVLWQADALLLMAQASLLVQMPLIIAAVAWIAALLLGRVMAMHKNSHED
jgi:hypothetical protein